MSNLGGGGFGGGGPKVPKGLPKPKRPIPERAEIPTRPQRPVHMPPGVAVDRMALDRMLDGRKRNPHGETPADTAGVANVGNPDLDIDVLRSMTAHLLAEHMMILLSNKRAEFERPDALAEVGELVIELDNAQLVKRVLNEMPLAGKIVDIYPLEVLAYVLGRRPDLLEDVAFEPFIRNKGAIQDRTFEVEEPIPLSIPVSMKVRGFALEGGGSPGYCFAPGPPGEYELEVGEPGQFNVLIRGDVRRESIIDRVRVHVVESPGSD